jgi:hypothetical protein
MAEMGIPGLHESCVIFDDERPQAVQLMGPKTMGLGEIDGVQPKLGNIIAMLDMDVRRLGSLEAVKEETKAKDFVGQSASVNLEAQHTI